MRTAKTATVTLCIAICLALPAASQNPCKKNPDCKEESSEPEPFKVYDGLLSIGMNGSIVLKRIVVQNWQIANDVTAEIPHQGWLIVELRAGSLTAEIGNESQKWHTGSFWSVPANHPLIVHTTRDSVVLQTMDLIPQ